MIHKCYYSIFAADFEQISAAWERYFSRIFLSRNLPIEPGPAKQFTSPDVGVFFLMLDFLADRDILIGVDDFFFLSVSFFFLADDFFAESNFFAGEVFFFGVFAG